MEKQVRVYFSPMKTQNWMTQTGAQECNVVNVQLGSTKQQQSKAPIKLFSSSVTTNYLEEAKFYDLVQQINAYEIEISGGCIKSQRTVLNVNEILDRLQNEQSLIVSTRVERVDIIKCFVRVSMANGTCKDAVIKISKDNESGYEIVSEFDEKSQKYFFWGKVNQEYYLDVSRKDCFSQKKQIFLKGNCDYVVEFDMVSCVETTLQFKAFNITESLSLIDGVSLEILQSDSSENESRSGMTDKNGCFVCSGLMFKQVKVNAKRKGFMSVSYDFDVRANSTGQVLQIPMIPDFYSLINQYHILVYIPNTQDFQLQFSLQCPDGQSINTQQKRHSFLRAQLETNRITKTARLMNFSVHVQSMDPFLPQNQFQFFVSNLKPSRALMCTQFPQPTKENKDLSARFLSRKNTNNILQTSNKVNLSPTKSVNEMFFKTRIQQTEIKSPEKKEAELIAQKLVHYCAEQSVRVFITFGHQVIDTFMIQSNLILQNEKCYGTIDLENRRFIKDDDTYQTVFKRELRQMPTFKSQTSLQALVQQEEMKLTQILSHITNQKFRH